jgi:hypothetical protein
MFSDDNGLQFAPLFVNRKISEMSIFIDVVRGVKHCYITSVKIVKFLTHFSETIENKNEKF